MSRATRILFADMQGLRVPRAIALTVACASLALGFALAPSGFPHTWLSPEPAKAATCTTSPDYCVADGNVSITLTSDPRCLWNVTVQWGDNHSDTKQWRSSVTFQHHYTGFSQWFGGVSGGGQSDDPETVTCVDAPFEFTVEVPFDCTYQYKYIGDRRKQLARLDTAINVGKGVNRAIGVTTAAGGLAAYGLNGTPTLPTKAAGVLLGVSSAYAGVTAINLGSTIDNASGTLTKAQADEKALEDRYLTECGLLPERSSRAILNGGLTVIAPASKPVVGALSFRSKAGQLRKSGLKSLAAQNKIQTNLAAAILASGDARVAQDPGRVAEAGNLLAQTAAQVRAAIKSRDRARSKLAKYLRRIKAIRGLRVSRKQLAALRGPKGPRLLRKAFKGLPKASRPTEAAINEIVEAARSVKANQLVGKRFLALLFGGNLAKADRQTADALDAFASLGL